MDSSSAAWPSMTSPSTGTRSPGAGDAGDAGDAGGGPRSKLLVWGHPTAEFHNHIYTRAKAAAAALGLECDVLGGGRIAHDAAARKLEVYGYSAAFGPAPHEVAAALLRRWHPLHSVGVSYEGY